MKKTILPFLLLGVFATALAQVTNQGEPKSWAQEQLNHVVPVILDAIDMERVAQEDAVNDAKTGVPYRFGVEIDVDFTLQNSGTWDELPNGDKVWRLNIISEGAKTMNFIFDHYYMPPGATMYLYSNDKMDLVGAYDASFNRPDKVMGTWTVDGDNIWIEYHEPKNQIGNGILNLGTVVHGYRSLRKDEAENRGLNDSGPCHLDVSCSIGEDYDEIKEQLQHSVAFMIMGGFLCSGSMINNVNNDQTPYLLTAKHCDPNNNPGTWAFRFNWISLNPSCATNTNSGAGTFNQTSGATRVSSNWTSDFMLLHIDGNINPNWNIVWAGWNRSNTQFPSFSVGIHHPAGDIMKVSRDNNQPARTAANIGGIGLVQSWRVNWNMGVTEGGSSGSPLFDHNGRIVGQLSGGSSACSGTSGNNSPDFYGRMDINWEFGNTPETRLKEWLDPDNTGATTVDLITLSTEDFQQISNIAVYPNPASDVIYIMNNNSTQLAYDLYNVQGQRVLSEAIPNVNSTVNVSNLNAGIYFLRLHDGASNSSVTKRIIVRR